VATGVFFVNRSLHCTATPTCLEKSHGLRMADVLTNVVTRPSTVTGAYYNRVSSGLFENVNKVLSREESAKHAVSQIERVAKGVVP